MKKMVFILYVISAFSVIPLLIAYNIYSSSLDPRNSFISLWFILLFTPVVFLRFYAPEYLAPSAINKNLPWWYYILFIVGGIRPVSLAESINKIPRKLWYKIYTVIFLTMTILFYLAFAHFGVSIINQTCDVPYVITKKYASIKGDVHIVNHIDNSESKTRVIGLANKKFYVTNRIFRPLMSGNTYHILYLPNTHYVMDIIDEDGRSLLKRN